MSKISGWFKGVVSKTKEKVSNLDKDDVLKWTCVLAAGGLGLLGEVFDRKKKDRLFQEEMRNEIKSQTERLLNGGSDEN